VLVEPELTTVADDEVVVHAGSEVRRYQELLSGTAYDLDGIDARTLDRPGGELLSVIATVNDIHFGETECGMVAGTNIGPVLRVEPGEPPYPQTMNRAAVAEIGQLCTGTGPDAVIVKGDITADGRWEDYEAFRECYEPTLGHVLHVVRGNHEGSARDTFADEPVQEITLPGVTVALLDTVVPGHHGGRMTAQQASWLDELGARADRPVLVMGHHHPWSPGSRTRPADYFGISPDDSEVLVEVMARRPALVGYFAGHTHRNRVRYFPTLGSRPIVEVASVKDFPGSWAEYRVFEGGILQIHRRISTPDALAWTDRTRAMYLGHYADYSFGQLSDRCLAIPI
jgi:predicted phosphodiesterase